MKCEEFREMATEYADEQLDSASRAGIEAHAKECPPCRRELEETLELFSSLKSGALEDPGDLYWRKFNNAVYSQLEAAAPRTFINFARRRAGAGAAAAAMLLISISGFLSMERNSARLPLSENPAASRGLIAAEEYEIISASLNNSAEIPDFNSLNTEEREAAASDSVYAADERADAILADSSYDAAPPNEYAIPREAQELTEEEAQSILDAMPAGDGGGET